MSREYVSFVLWLYATSIIRDGIASRGLSEETIWFYNLSLKVMQEASKRKVAEYTEPFLCSMACFAAASVSVLGSSPWHSRDINVEVESVNGTDKIFWQCFSGMFAAATWHHNAMIKALALKGHGDIVAGLLQCSPWTQKAIQWYVNSSRSVQYKLDFVNVFQGVRWRLRDKIANIPKSLTCHHHSRTRYLTSLPMKLNVWRR
jgi:hypothetical protein